MAYTLGFWFADGSIENSFSIRGHYIRIGSTDGEVIKYIKHALQSEHQIYKTLRPGFKDFYLLKIGNLEMFQDLVKLGWLCFTRKG